MAYSSLSPDPGTTPGMAPARKRRSPVPFVVGGVVLLVVLVVVAALLIVRAGGDSTRRGLQEPDGRIGDTVVNKTVQFTVTGVEEGPAVLRSDRFSSVRELEPQGRFVTVHITMGNLGTDNATVSTDDQLVYDDQGRAYQPTAYLPYIGPQLSISSVNPGNERRESYVYDLPEGTAPFTILLSEKVYISGGDGVLISLR